MLCVASVVFYASKDGARRHPWVVGAFCGLWQADIYCPLTPGHDTEHPDSNEHMSVIPSSSAGLGEAQQESHNAKYGTEPHNCTPTFDCLEFSLLDKTKTVSGAYLFVVFGSETSTTP